MSFIVAFMDRDTVCIAADSQKNNLATGEVFYDAVKIRKISCNVVVGYAGDYGVCQSIIEILEALYCPSELSRENIDLVINGIKCSIATLDLIPIKNGANKPNIIFLVAGRDKKGRTLACAVVPNDEVKIYWSDSNTMEGKYLLIPPHDLSYDECATQAIEIVRALYHQAPLRELAVETVSRIANLSSFVGGEIQFLEVV